jgi:ALG6, ALG8 glycosyltransferase family
MGERQAEDNSAQSPKIVVTGQGNNSAQSPERVVTGQGPEIVATGQGTTYLGQILSDLLITPRTPSWLVLLVIILASVLFRAIIGLGSYSGTPPPPHLVHDPTNPGHSSPPMYGDFEAQRHWMEITLHLPLKQWYYYDLQWWGLDYPPLTAYISYVFGKMYHPSPRNCANVVARRLAGSGLPWTSLVAWRL